MTRGEGADQELKGAQMHIGTHRSLVQFFSLATLLAVGPATLYAAPDDSAPAALDEVVVTAQKRPEKLQDVPITISAFDAATLDREGITSVAELGLLVPGLVYTDVVGYGLPYLRGVGTSATGPGFENPVATYVDGVYYASQIGALVSLNNVASVEVDKGPQGTLFGRNATGGAIQVHTLDPSDHFSGVAELGYGNYNTQEGQLYVTGPLAPGLSANLALSYRDQRDGYGKNLFNGDDVDRFENGTVRGKIKYTPGDATTIILTLDMERGSGVPTVYPAPGTIPQFGPPIAANPRDLYGSPEPFSHTAQGGVALSVEQQIGSLTLTNLAAFRHTIFDAEFDSTLTAVPGTTFILQGDEPHSQATEELQLASAPGSAFDWIVGAYLYWEHAGDGEATLIAGDSFTTFGVPGGLTQAPNDLTYSAALYGQTTYHFTSATSGTLGLRYTDEYKDDQFVQVTPAFDQTEIFKNHINFLDPSWRLALQHDFSPGMMTYGSYSRGFKSGGYNDGTPYYPEKLDAFEVGLKTISFQDTLRVNAAAFYYKYQDIQTVSYPDGSLIIANGAGAQIYGLDLDGSWAATHDLRFSASAEYLFSKFTSFPNGACSVPLGSDIVDGVQLGYGTAYESCNNTGRRVPKTPDVTLSTAVDYSRQLPFGKFAANVSYSYNSGYYGEADNRLYQPSYGVVDAFVGLSTSDDTLRVRFYGKNLTDKLYSTFIASESNGDNVQWAPPRTYGVTVTKKF
jgi:iron complex outermembrane receptor protein